MELLNIHVSTDARRPDDRHFDVAECKGAGHPDTLSDQIADEFSRRYSAYSLTNYGQVLNHWVDKVTLIGAASEVKLGSYKIIDPIRCLLIGKITPSVGNEKLPIAQLFNDVCRDVFSNATGNNSMFSNSLTEIYNTAGTAADHPVSFYRPATPEDAVLRAANDTSASHANSSTGICGKVALGLERASRSLTSTDSRIGSDFKVMCTRFKDTLRVTVAVPVHADRVATWDDYQDATESAAKHLTTVATELLKAHDKNLAVDVRVNTKDTKTSGYLAPFGTSLGKGDCGAVGRGNRISGVIEPMAPSSAEAPAGKNPIHHAGKVHTWLAHELAQSIEVNLGLYSEVTVVSSNGEDLFEDPQCFVAVEDSGVPVDKEWITKNWRELLENIHDRPRDFLEGGRNPNA